MAEKEFLTVQEIADIVGVTSQAIYRRLNTNLKPFVKTLEGRKYISRDALRVLLANEPTDETNKTNFSGLDLKAFEQTLAVLSAQLTAKDRQIAELNDRLAELNARLEQSMNNADLIHKTSTIKQLQAENPRRGLFDWLRGK